MFPSYPDPFRNSLLELETAIQAARADSAERPKCDEAQAFAPAPRAGSGLEEAQQFVPPPYIDEGTRVVGSDGKPVPPSRDVMSDFLKATEKKPELHGIDQPGGPIVVDMSMTLRPDKPRCEEAQALETPQIGEPTVYVRVTEPQQVPNAEMPHQGKGLLAATPRNDAQRKAREMLNPYILDPATRADIVVVLAALLLDRDQLHKEKSVLADALATAERVARLPHPDTAFLDEVIKVAHSYGVPDTATREATAKVLEMILKNYENAAKRTLANLDSIAHVIRQKIGTLPGHEQIAAAIEHHMAGTNQPPSPTATRVTKYPLLHVKWVDSRLPSSAWNFMKDIKGGPSHCVSVGYRVREDSMSITLVPNVADENGGENMQVSGEIVIPKRAIISSSQAANEEWMLAE